jgi:hypothetical protein
MEIQEVYERYLAGEKVEDPYATAPDLEYVIYPEEDDYVWRMVVLPLDAAGADLSLEATPGCTQEDEDKRFDGIRSWMAEKGIVAALADCPPIVRMTDEFGVDMVDGRHRLALAHQAGITEIKMMVGAAPGCSPAFTPTFGG